MNDADRGATIGINAGRARSGGAVAHLLGILREVNPEQLGISKVCVWSYASLLERLPERSWLIRRHARELEGSLPAQLWWERTRLPRALREASCDIVLNVDAGTVCRFRPAVTISRDMLSYEPGEIGRYGASLAGLRLWVLRHAQNTSLRAADTPVFLTRYGADVIQRSSGRLPRARIIPHGVGENFRAIERRPRSAASSTLRCVYVSNTAPYKHQWHVVRAIELLRARGFDLELELVGGGTGPAQTRLERQIAASDPGRKFVTLREFVPSEALPTVLASADLFIFASSCEHMPNTLVEAMAAGLPIACSNRGPMPEVLRDAGVYFDPEAPDSIAGAVETLVTQSHLRTELAARAKTLAAGYSWRRCADETFACVAETLASVHSGPPVRRQYGADELPEPESRQLL